MSIDIEQLTVGQLKSLRAQIDEILKPPAAQTVDKIPLGTKVLVRTYSAGVHVGVLAARDGREVLLRDTRRIHRWRGANSLSEMSIRGIDSAAKSDYSRVSDAAVENLLTEAIELLPVTSAAWESICGAGWAS